MKILIGFLIGFILVFNYFIFKTSAKCSRMEEEMKEE